MVRIRCEATLLLVGMAVLLSADPARACMRPYVSQERLLKRARHILEVEVLSVGEASPPSEEWIQDGEDSYRDNRKDARARVRVVRELRGRLDLEEFTLIGGPYDSCAFFPCYVTFEAGERLFLLLDGPVPRGTETVQLSLWGRVFRGTEEDLRARLAWSVRWWRERLALLQEAAPTALAEARRLSSLCRSGAALLPSDLEGASYETLLSLVELLRDPEHPVPAGSPEAGGPTYVTRLQGDHSLPEPLAAALQTMRQDHAREVAETNRDLLRRFLVERLMQPGSRADRFVEAVEEECFARARLPLRGLKLTKGADRETVSVYHLLRLADDEPDGIVRARYRARHGSLDPRVLVPWLSRWQESLPAIEARLRVAASIPDRDVAPFVVRCLSQDLRKMELEACRAYFEAIGDGVHAAEVAARLGE
jgi:hypothetical protein